MRLNGVELKMCDCCGLILDAFGCCPRANPEDVRLGIKQCFPIQHPDACLCSGCVNRQVVTQRILDTA